MQSDGEFYFACAVAALSFGALLALAWWAVYEVTR